MKPGVSATQEVINYRRSAATPGIQIVDAQDSPREWRIVSPELAVVVFRTWRGPVHFGGRTLFGKPGTVFCSTSDELMVSRPEGGNPGSFNVIEFAPELFKEWLSEQRGVPRDAQWEAAVKLISPELSRKFRHFFDSFEPGGSPLQLQSELLQVSEALVNGLVSGTSERGPLLRGPPLRGTARMRECIHEEGFDIDLETLASKVGLSRFQALRAFKRRYGLPPHAYQLAVRLNLARRMLVEGAASVDVAMHCGFVDQSHFNRHFKRAFGVTPMQYARGHGLTSGVYLASRLVEGDPHSIVSRSDRGRP
jgi:AraC-like DNA-binding protein